MSYTPHRNAAPVGRRVPAETRPDTVWLPNIWKQASAVSSIERLTQLFRADGYSEQKARLAALAEYQTKAIRNVRCRIGEQIFKAADGCGSEETLAKNLRRLQSIDRYEKRIASLKKRVFQKMQWEI